MNSIPPAKPEVARAHSIPVRPLNSRLKATFIVSKDIVAEMPV